MKRIPEKKKLLILFYWDLGIRSSASADTLKVSDTFVKNTLRENNRTGPQPTPDQALNTWLYLNQQIGEPTINFLSKDNQQREQQLKEKINELEKKNIQLTDELQKAKDREQDQKQEFETRTEELEQKNLKIEDLKQRNTELTTEKETEKQENKKLQDKADEQYERIIEVERELGEQKIKVTELEHEKRTMQKEHHDELENINKGATTLITKFTLSEKMNNTLIEKITQYQKEVLRLEENVQNWKIGTICGVVGGVVVGIGGVLIYQKLSNPSSADSENNTVYEAIPLIGFGNGCGIVISPILQKYIQQA